MKDHEWLPLIPIKSGKGVWLISGRSCIKNEFSLLKKQQAATKNQIYYTKQ